MWKTAKVAFAAVVWVSLGSCGGGGGSTPTTPAQPAATLVPAAVTQNFFCSAFDIGAGEGAAFDVQLPTTGALRGVADWNVTGTNVDLYWGYWGCPNVRAIVNGGCTVLGRDTSTAKPAQFSQNILDNDLRVDPGKPGARIVYAYNPTGARTQGIIQLSLTSNGAAPTSGGPTCAAVPPPPPSPTPRPPGGGGGGGGGATCDGTPAPNSCQVGNGPPPATARCNDGLWSCSQNRSGTCSGHGGVACWVCPGPLC
jgi:hypothetical protein